MKNTLLFSALFLLCSFGVVAQSVSFTQTSGLIGSITGSSIRDCTVDMNGDYLDDIVRVQNDGINIDYQKSDGTYLSKFYPMSVVNTPSWSICAGDLDENGFNDLLFGNGSAVSFVMANEIGNAYTEYPNPDYIFSQRSTLFDIDQDGDLDAFVCHDIDLSHPYRNDGNGVMVEDQELIHTVNLPGNYAAIWVDYNNDGYTDMYLTKCRGGAAPGNPARTNGLYHNNGDGTFTEVGAEANMDDNAQSWATVFEDFDNDGDFDAFIVNHDIENRFKLNNGDGTFTDMIHETGIAPYDLGAWANAGADFNNDGFVDIIAEISPSLYINNGDLTFTGQNAPFSDGGIGDFNNDGFLDVIRGNQVYINDGNDNNWIKINTQGIISNKNGIGARVEIYGEWGMQIREVRSGQSFRPMSSLCAHFGIGAATAVDSVVIRWPSGTVTSVENPSINTGHNLAEAACVLAPEVIQINGNSRICEGETVELIAPGGFETHTWSTGDTNPSLEVGAGSYGLILYDNAGCVSIAENIVISEHEDVPPTLFAEGDLTTCAGESVMLTASDGENHIWSNGMTGQTIEVQETGVYTVAIDALCSEEPIGSEQSIEVDILEPVAPEIETVEVDGDGVALLTAIGENLFWFDVAEGGTSIGDGNSLQTEMLTEDAIYYVESHNIFGGGIQQGGKLTTEGGGGIPSVGAHSFFDAFEDFTILSVEVTVPDGTEAGPRTIQLFDGDDVLLNEIIVDLELGLQTVELNFEVAEGTGYSLRCPENNIFRNNSSVAYPYPIGDGVGELTTSVYGGGYYYYFYNWQIEAESITCVSERIPVQVVVVGVNDLTEVSDLRVFPNPATDKVNLELTFLEDVDLNLSLTNSLGQVVVNKQLSTLGLGQHIHTVDVSLLPAGVYQLQLSNSDRSTTMKVVVE